MRLRDRAALIIVSVVVLHAFPGCEVARNLGSSRVSTIVCPVLNSKNIGISYGGANNEIDISLIEVQGLLGRKIVYAFTDALGNVFRICRKHNARVRASNFCSVECWFSRTSNHFIKYLCLDIFGRALASVRPIYRGVDRGIDIRRCWLVDLGGYAHPGSLFGQHVSSHLMPLQTVDNRGDDGNGKSKSRNNGFWMVVDVALQLFISFGLVLLCSWLVFWCHGQGADGIIRPWLGLLFFVLLLLSAAQFVYRMAVLI